MLKHFSSLWKTELRLIPQPIHYARAVKKKKNKCIISSIISMEICSLLHEIFNPRTLFCFVFKKKDKNSQRHSLNNQDKTKSFVFFGFFVCFVFPFSYWIPPKSSTFKGFFDISYTRLSGKCPPPDPFSLSTWLPRRIPGNCG